MQLTMQAAAGLRSGGPRLAGVQMQLRPIPVEGDVGDDDLAALIRQRVGETQAAERDRDVGGDVARQIQRARRRLIRVARLPLRIRDRRARLDRARVGGDARRHVDGQEPRVVLRRHPHDPRGLLPQRPRTAETRDAVDDQRIPPRPRRLRAGRVQRLGVAAAAQARREIRQPVDEHRPTAAAERGQRALVRGVAQQHRVDADALGGQQRPRVQGVAAVAARADQQQNARGVPAQEIRFRGGEHHLRRVGDGLGRVPHQFIRFILRPQQGPFGTADLVDGEDGFHDPRLRRPRKTCPRHVHGTAGTVPKCCRNPARATPRNSPLTVTRRNRG